MATITWAGRLASLGASLSEVAAIQAAYDASTSNVRRAVNELVEGIDSAGLLTMLSTWRAGLGPFSAGLPGGGLPFGTHVAVTSGVLGDDAFALGAGTGAKITAGGGTIAISSPDGSVIVGGTSSAPTLEAVPAPTGQVWINVLATPAANVRWNTLTQSSAAFFGAFIQSDTAVNAEVTFNKYLQAGTYTMDVYYFSGANRGIFTPFVDGVQLGTTIDTFAASGVATRATIANIVVTGSTLHALRFLIAAKNATSTAFLGAISGIGMTRTGP
jgi:hypothetical protein